MSKSIAVLPSSKLFRHQQLRQGVFRGAPELATEFNTPQDPLSYREQLDAPPAARVKTGFAFMDTSIRLIYDKKDDPTSPLRGIRFNSHGVGFRIEKPNVTGNAPFYEAIVLTDAKDQMSYRMTPDDIAFSLSCMAQECDVVDDKQLAQLYALFTQHALTDVPVDKKASNRFNMFNQERTFEFNVADRVYSAEVPDGANPPKFVVKGFDERNALKLRPMTLAEVKYTIDKIVADTPRDELTSFARAIQKMREYSWDLADAAKATTTRSPK